MQQIYQCPKCKSPIIYGAQSCNNCSQRFTWPQQRTQSPAQQEPLQPPVQAPSYQQPVNYQQQVSPPYKQQFSNFQPIWHLVLLSIITLDIYQIYWFYRNWKQLKVHKNLDISPGWRTAGLFVPIYGLVLIYRQFRDINNFAGEAGITKIHLPGNTLGGWIILNALYWLPDPFWLLGSATVWPLALVQSTLNSYWEKEQPGLKVKPGFSAGEIAIIVIGGILMVIILIGTFLPLIFSKAMRLG